MLPCIIYSQAAFTQAVMQRQGIYTDAHSMYAQSTPTHLN